MIDSALAIVLLALSLTLLAVVAAAEAGVATANRTRLKSLMHKGHSRAERLHAFANERASVLAVLALTRTFAAAVATSLAVFLVAREMGDTWGMLLVVVVAAVLASPFSTPLPCRRGETGGLGLRLVPVISLRMVFGPVAGASTACAVVGSNGYERDDDDAEDPAWRRSYNGDRSEEGAR
jgi:CBS domain containing-hemolysin-like protein